MLQDPAAARYKKNILPALADPAARSAYPVILILCKALAFLALLQQISSTSSITKEFQKILESNKIRTSCCKIACGGKIEKLLYWQHEVRILFLFFAKKSHGLPPK